MSKGLLLLLFFIPVFAQAQITEVTEEQKRMALQKVTEFCSLLKQWSKGQRILDAKIYALCSGNDCSAYDDVSTNKETTMRNYLLGIQKKYPRNLDMDISQPTFSDCEIVYEPMMILFNTEALTQGGQLYTKIQSYKNAYMVFSVSQTNIGRTESKKVIFDIKTKKITAFIKGDGTYISYLDGLTLITKRNYQTAIRKFLYAAQNNRASLQKKCYTHAGYVYTLMGDYDNAIKYFNMSNVTLMSDMVKATRASSSGDSQTAIGFLLQIEQRIKSSGEMTEQLPYVYLMLGTIYYLGNSRKSISYLELAAEKGLAASGYIIYKLTMISNIHGEGDFYDIVGDKAFQWLRWSAERGYTPAFYDLGYYEQIVRKSETEAIRWFEYSAVAGNPMGMASYGKKLIEHGNKEEGKKWLKRALEGNTLDLYLKTYDNEIGLIYWPKSRHDVQTLLDGLMR